MLSANVLTDKLISQCFTDCFEKSENVVMYGGAPEPLYLAANADSPAQIYYREDFAASVLHEAAHWCIAGKARRATDDFGYLYKAPPRTASLQAQFFALEIRVQTLELLFCEAAGLAFQASADNLGVAVDEFVATVTANRPKVANWMLTTVDGRAHKFCCALRRDRVG